RYRRDPETARWKGYRPWAIIISTLLFVVRESLVIALPQEYQYLFIWLGDIADVVHLRIHFNILLLTYDYCILFVQFIHFQVSYRFKRYGIEPNLKPFNLAAGLITPRSAGLLEKSKV